MAEFATGNRDDALELVQDAMLGLVQRYRNREASEWPPLFYRILESRIRDWYRRRQVRNRWVSWWGDWKARQEDDPMPEPEFAGPAGEDPVRRLETGEQLDAVHAALAAMPLRQQQAVLLRVWQGLDVAETAFAMGCSEGSVKTHLSRGMARLRAVVAGGEDDTAG